ncbi:protein-export membrane protein SecD [Hahella sp. CCB-MM4]|uniref:protein translocase subunit SecD n=1 Tax=Hahella sp. (strain CCB-MM4) TaxID=1926491 RepID=UPI000B9C14F2|nr:protein translocase subunit SecD [Hahella sp. CCB-MM4]OZG73847.1 protein-export membrane protein SecD [Hahella sp. CCB-MM4]
MLNKNPLWKNLLILAVLVLGFIYALPNLYPDDYALQISGARGSTLVDEDVLQRTRKALDDADISFKSAAIENSVLTVRFSDNDNQLKAQPRVQQALGDRYVVALNLVPTTPEWLANMGASPMKLGLDLRGGVHFLMEVDLEKAIEQTMEVSLGEIKTDLREEKLRYRSVEQTGDREISVLFPKEEDRDNALNLSRRQLTDFLAEGVEKDGMFGVRLTLLESRAKEIEDYAVSQNLSTLRNRVNELGVAEPLVQRQGRGRIVVELPGVQDTALAKRILGATANLEFRLEAKPDASSASTERYEFRSRPDTALLEKDIIITGSSVASAAQNFDQNGRPQVNIKLDSAGGKKMYRVTVDAIHRKMAVLFVEHKERTRYVQVNGEPVEKKDRYVEKKIISLATIQSALGTDFRITGLDSAAEAGELALLLRSGALAAPIYFVEERTVGPSLGQKNIEAGTLSVVLGFALVLVFMIFYYRFFGLVANIALAANVFILIAVMSLLSATLTLPGIAGIVLTVGMAVDANVLIYERIREELRNGMTPQSAIHAGYDRAFVSIFDANITTLIAALILFAVGTGPVKGFAVTLSIGIITSMFTAIVVTRAVVNLAYGGRRIDKLSIGSAKSVAVTGA